MKINYKKELESAAKNMILVHEPEALIKNIISMLLDKIRVSHVSMLLEDRLKDSFVLAFSSGALCRKIPVGLVKIDKDEPIIKFFQEKKNKAYFDNGVVSLAGIKRLISAGVKEADQKIIALVSHQMQVLETHLCIPSYFHDELLGILLLGAKQGDARFGQDEVNFLVVLATDVAMAVRNAQLFKQLEEELYKKEQLFVRTTIALVAAIEAKDHYTHGHTTRVANLSLELAKDVIKDEKGKISPKFAENVHLSSLLHDIGKIGIPEYILNKKSGLTLGERNKIRQHPAIGVTILKPIRELGPCLQAIMHHHERFDGAGYPAGLSGGSIPLEASIIAIADSFDAMTTDRAYRPAMSRPEALRQIKALSGAQFNPKLVQSFLRIAERGAF